MTQEARLVLAMDIGGTQIRLALVREAEIRALHATRWPKQCDPESEVDFIAGLARDLIRERADGQVVGVGVALAALTDRQGMVVLWPNRPTWQGLPFRDLLQQQIGLPVVIEDDANAAALAEWRFGAGQGYRHILVLMAGTGIGAGLVLDGALFHGRHGWAGELGHMVVAPNGPPCSCGLHGCLQALASGRALEQSAAALGLGDVQQLAAAAAQGQPDAREVIEQAGRWIGLAAANMVNVLDLEAVIVGGGLSALGSLWWSAIRETLYAGLLNATHRSVALHKAILPDTAGLLGAALLARAAEAGRAAC